MNIEELPNEIVGKIIDDIELDNFNSISRSSHRLHNIFQIRIKVLEKMTYKNLDIIDLEDLLKKIR